MIYVNLLYNLSAACILANTCAHLGRDEVGHGEVLRLLFA